MIARGRAPARFSPAWLAGVLLLLAPEWVAATPIAASTRLRRPTNLVATALSVSAVRLTWRDAASGETGFVVETRALSETTWRPGMSLPANSQRVDLATGLAPETGYDFRVRAVAGNKSSRPSLIARATTLAEPKPCAVAEATLCLGESGRFRAQAVYEAPGAPGAPVAARVGPGPRTGEEGRSGVFFFQQPELWEVLVRLQSDCAAPDGTGRHRVTIAGMTIWKTLVTVVDTTTGAAFATLHRPGGPFQTVEEVFPCP